MWKFQTNDSGQLDGWNDNGIQTFRSNTLKNLAREIIQNSVDAKLKNGKPAIVKFTLDELPREAIPEIDELRDRLIDIVDIDAKNEGESHRLEMNDALACSKSAKFLVLSISDENTDGMPGGSLGDTTSAFFRYMKASGSSGGDQNRAGSHGLGKAAPLATTPLRTIFVSSCFQDDASRPTTIYQGRCRLMSRTIEGVVSSGTGYWGDNNYNPLQSLPSEKYAWLKRDVRGTTIAVPGFRSDAKREWSPIMAGYIVSEFFAAISRDTLAVKIVDNTAKGKTAFEINSQTIANPKKFFTNQYIKEQIDIYVDKNTNDLQDAHYYFRCLSEKTPGLIRKNFTISGLGEVRLSLLIEENAPRKLCIIRKNMKITEEINAGQGGRSLWKPGYVPAKILDFVGVVEVVGDDGNSLLRSMEPPQHNSLSIDNMPEEHRETGRRILKELSTELRSIIEDLATAEVEKERPVSEIAEYFHDDSDYDPDAATVTKEVDPNGRVIIRKKPLVVRSTNPKEFLGEGEDPTRGYRPKRRRRTVDPSPDPFGPETGHKKSQDRNIALEHQRLVGQNITYKLYLRSKSPFDGYLSILDLGLDLTDSLKVKKSSVGSVTKTGVIKVSTKDFINNSLMLDLELNSAPIGGITVIASEPK